MKTCGTCGEPVPDSCAVCPYCESPLAPAAANPDHGRPREKLRTLNLEHGHPTVEDALDFFHRELNAALSDGVRMLRVIHGKGTNTAGRALIRDEFRRQVEFLRGRQTVRAVFYGENVRPTREWRRRYPFLAPWERQDRENGGITFVEL